MITTTETHHDVRSAVPVGLALVFAYLVMGTGVAYAGLALGDAVVRVPVELTAEAPARMQVVLPCVEGWSLDGLSGCEPSVSPQVWPGGEPLPTEPTGGLTTETSTFGATTALLASSPGWASLIAGGIALLVLIPVIRTTAEGRPFAPGNSRRLAAAAAATVAGWVGATVGPYLAADAVLRTIEATPRRAGLAMAEYDMPAGWLAPDLRLAWWPLLVIALLACFAVATRHGARLADDVDGLV